MHFLLLGFFLIVCTQRKQNPIIPDPRPIKLFEPAPVFPDEFYAAEEM